MPPIVVIRPEPGCSSTCADARATGLNALPYPLFRVTAQDWIGPHPASIDALLIGSANAVRHGGPELEQYRAKPVFAVGQTTAHAASAYGFHVAGYGIGGLQQVLDHAPAQYRRFLRLSGAAHVALKPPQDATIETRILYASEPQNIPLELQELLQKPAVVLLHSGIAAEHFLQECKRLHLPINHLHIAALAPRIAEAAGHGWASLSIAKTAQDSALLALASKICQKGLS